MPVFYVKFGETSIPPEAPKRTIHGRRRIDGEMQGCDEVPVQWDITSTGSGAIRNAHNLFFPRTPTNFVSTNTERNRMSLRSKSTGFPCSIIRRVGSRRRSYHRAKARCQESKLLSRHTQRQKGCNFKRSPGDGFTKLTMLRSNSWGRLRRWHVVFDTGNFPDGSAQGK
jgi:hypothetical protein